jgi:hypothetical protein
MCGMERLSNEALPVQAMVLLHPKEEPLCLTGTVSKICWRFYTGTLRRRLTRSHSIDGALSIGRKIKLPATIAIKHQLRKLMFEDSVKKAAALIVAAGVNQASDSFLIQRAGCKAGSVGGLVSPIYGSTRREK